MENTIVKTEIINIEHEIKSLRHHIQEYRRLCEIDREKIEGYVNYRFDRGAIPFRRIFLTYLFSFFAFLPVSGIASAFMALGIMAVNPSWYFGYVKTFLVVFFIISFAIMSITRFGSRDLISRYEEKRFRESHKTEIEAYLSREDQINKWTEQIKSLELEIESYRKAEMDIKKASD